MKKRNSTLYSHPFSVSYWKDALKEHLDLRSIALAAVLCAIAIVIEKFNLPLSTTLQISLSFFAIGLCSMLTGPVMAVFCGMIVDLVGSIGSPYPFFAGYTLTAVLTALLYALFLYRAKVTFWRIFAAEAVINLFVNTALGSLWRLAMYGGFYNVYLVQSGLKNLVLLLPEVLLLGIFLTAVSHPLKMMGVLSSDIRVIYSKKTLLLSGIVAVIGFAGVIAYICLV